ncbi:MAG TPA: membrane protein insertase YidC, partial [Terriglobales bacterium]|nr:membrane protein insertase YidC [Terriglobales bacterium]
MPDFPNPQHEPGMERRLLLVFALTFLVIIAFQPLLRKYLPQAPPPPAKAENQSPAQNVAGVIPPVAAKSNKATPNSVATKQASSESEAVIENDLYRITFTNRGGQVKSWVLKKYDDEQGR